MATRTAPPTMATTSRVRPVGMAAPPVWRPGCAELVVVVADEPVGVTCTTVTAVTVLRLPSGKVVVLS